MKNAISQLKWAVTLVLGASLGIFVLQNTAELELQFLNWTFRSRRSVIVGLCVAIGVIIGSLFGYSAGRRR